MNFESAWAAFKIKSNMMFFYESSTEMKVQR